MKNIQAKSIQSEARCQCGCAFQTRCWVLSLGKPPDWLIWRTGRDGCAQHHRKRLPLPFHVQILVSHAASPGSCTRPISSGGPVNCSAAISSRGFCPPATGSKLHTKQETSCHWCFSSLRSCHTSFKGFKDSQSSRDSRIHLSKHPFQNRGKLRTTGSPDKILLAQNGRLCVIHLGHLGLFLLLDLLFDLHLVIAFILLLLVLHLLPLDAAAVELLGVLPHLFTQHLHRVHQILLGHWLGPENLLAYLTASLPLAFCLRCTSQLRYNQCENTNRASILLQNSGQVWPFSHMVWPRLKSWTRKATPGSKEISLQRS